MSLEPLLSAPLPIPWHAFAAFAALAVGGAQLALVGAGIFTVLPGRIMHAVFGQ